MLTLKSSIDYFKKKSHNELSTKNEDKINYLNDLKEESEKLKIDAENYYVKYEKMKEKYYKLKQTAGNSQIESNNYAKVINI